MLLLACTESTPVDSPVTRARQSLEAGEPDAAIVALRDAIRADPGDAEIRLMLAEAYLDLGDGSRAAATLDQAVDRGLDPHRAALPYGRALYLNGQFTELLERPVPPDLGPGDHVRFVSLKAEARSELSAADAASDEVVRDFVDLLALIDRHRNDADVADVAARLETARTEREDINRAWHHFRCRKDASRPVGWTPVDRPGSRVLHVGPDRQIRAIADAARIANDGDTVEIDPGTYRGGVALWPQNDLVVRGSGDRPLVTADGKSIQGRDVWLFLGDNVVVENVEISGARSPVRNGAGIRHTGSGLTLRHVLLHDNENGVLTGNRFPDSNEILIEYSEFANNGDHEGFAHNIYIGRSNRFELRYSYSHGARGGHLVKSRARENLIEYNRLTDEEGGQSSYVIDIPEGGAAAIVGNVIEQAATTLNHGMISFAGESGAHAVNRLSIVSNSIYNRDFQAVVVRNHRDLDVVMANNLLGGAPAQTTDSMIELVNNQMLPEHGMRDPRNYDYGLIAGAAAVDAGVQFDIVPAREYVHPVTWRTREPVWRPDIGAYERCGID